MDIKVLVLVLLLSGCSIEERQTFSEMGFMDWLGLISAAGVGAGEGRALGNAVTDDHGRTVVCTRTETLVVCN